MKKNLLIAGIVILIAGVLSLSLAALFMFTHRNTYDGSPEFYSRLHQRTLVFFVIGAVLAVAGIVCITIRFKM